VKILCYSSFTFTYLDRARVLFASLRRHHPDWTLVALITDAPPEGLAFDAAQEDFDTVVYSQALVEDGHDAWLFKHDVVEACTAVKGPFLHRACADPAAFGDPEAVIYLDPDTCLFAPLDTVTAALADHDIVLTPHLLEPEIEEAGVRDNEISALRTGIYNLGFVAVRTEGEGARFARWWAERLRAFCYDDIPAGLFTDQRWCDHVPAFFERVKVLRDPGCNVASWNISRRRVEIGRDGAIRVNGAILRFWHFTKLGRVGEAMTRRYAGDNHAVYEIWNWYKRRVEECAAAGVPDRWWAYGAYADGTPVEKRHRVLYRERSDLQAAFPQPFASGEGTFQAWLGAEGLLA
jgi:hypothetical protein